MTVIKSILDTNTNELVLTVDGDGLMDLARMLRNGKSIKLQIEPSADHCDSPIHSLNIVVNDAGTVTIDTNEGEMSIAGGPRAMAVLGEQILEFGVMNDLYEPGMHAHFEAEPAVKRSVIAAGSTPLVIYGPSAHTQPTSPTSHIHLGKVLIPVKDADKKD
jgi:hypothetical protein